jgi:hypothetical protein
VSAKSELLTKRVQTAYKQLSVAATALNSASDELGETISALDAALKKLALGIPTWHRIGGGEDEDYNYWDRYIGYAKIGTKWGVALSTVSGNRQYPEHENDESWLFNDAPRSFRIEAVDKIPDLLEALIAKVAETTKTIQTKTTEAKELAEAITGVAKSAAPERK